MLIMFLKFLLQF